MATKSQALLKVVDIGALGVNVDADPLSLEDQELRLAQNAIRDPLGADSGLRKRPGLTYWDLTLLAGPILGGIGVPILDSSPAASINLYIGRGSTT